VLVNLAFAFSENLTEQLAQLDKMQDKGKALALSFLLFNAESHSPAERKNWETH